MIEKVDYARLHSAKELVTAAITRLKRAEKHLSNDKNLSAPLKDFQVTLENYRTGIELRMRGGKWYDNWFKGTFSNILLFSITNCTYNIIYCKFNW